MNRDVIFETIRRNVLEVLPYLDAEEVSIDGSLSELGANSVDRADVVTMTMADLDVAVPVCEFQDIRDLRSLVDLLTRHLDAAAARVSTR